MEPNHDPDGIFNRTRPTRTDPDARDSRGGRDRGGAEGGTAGRNPLPGDSQRSGNFGRGRESTLPDRDRARDIFSRTAEGRRYRNGIVLRDGGSIPYPALRPYFPWGYSYYPYYCPTFTVGLSYWSPYSYYYGVCPTYIYRRHCFYSPPSYIYIEVPFYVRDESRGYDNDLDDYYLTRNRYRYDDREPGLDRAIDDLREAFRFGSIEPLVQLTDPSVKVAIFLKGKYEYSLESNDYLDMTRDAFRAMDTVQFDLYRFKRRAAGVYVVSGRHDYRDRDGKKRTVYVSFVLERLSDRWILTQVGTAPDRIQEWK